MGMLVSVLALQLLCTGTRADGGCRVPKAAQLPKLLIYL